MSTGSTDRYRLDGVKLIEDGVPIATLSTDNLETAQRVVNQLNLGESRYKLLVAVFERIAKDING